MEDTLESLDECKHYQKKDKLTVDVCTGDVTEGYIKYFEMENFNFDDFMQHYFTEEVKPESLK